MAQARPRKINGELSFNADLVYASVLIAKSSQGLAYDATEGFRQVATLSVASDQSFNVGVETEAVDTGAIITTKDDLIQRLTGEASFQFTDMNPLAGKWSMGTTAEIQWDTSGTAWQGTIAGTTSTSTVLQFGTGEATGLAENDVLRIPLSSGNNLNYFPGIVEAVDTTADTATLKYPIPEGQTPATSAVVDRVRGYDLYHGGNILQNMKLLVQLDFPKGDQHTLEVIKCSSTGGFTRQLSGAVKTPMNIKMYGTSQGIGTLTDQVTCAVTHVGFPNR